MGIIIVLVLCVSFLLSAEAAISICHRCDCSLYRSTEQGSDLPSVEITCSNNKINENVNNFRLPSRASRLFMSVIGLDEVPEKVLLNSSTLTHLDLSSNHIKEIPGFAFVLLNELKYLDLSGNLINHITPDGFRGCSGLQTLLMNQNDLLLLPDRFIDRIPAVKVLDLSRNPLGAYFEGDSHFLHPLVYGDAPNLLHLNLDAIGLKLNAKTASFSLQGARHLENLTLRDNRMEVLPDLPRFLQRLDVSRSDLRVIEANSLPYLRSLLELTIQDAPHLRVIAAHAFSSLPNLQTLRLDGCQDLDAFSELAFGRDVQNSQLRELSMAGTSVRGLDQKLQPVVSNLTRFTLNGAPWHCNCSASWLIPYAPQELRCSSPAPVSGLFLHGLRPSDLLCAPDSPYADTLSVVGVLMAFAALIISCMTIWLICKGAQLSRRIFLRKAAAMPSSTSPYGRITVEPNDAENVRV